MKSQCFFITLRRLGEWPNTAAQSPCSGVLQYRKGYTETWQEFE